MGELLQAPRAGIRGAGVRRLVAAQPLRTRPHPAVQAGIGAGDACRASLSRSGVQPVPHVRGAAARGLEGIARDYELPAPMETNLYHLTADERRERGIVSLPETLGEAIDEFARSELMRARSAPHLRQLHAAQAQGVGRLPGSAHAVGAGPVPRRALKAAVSRAPGVLVVRERRTLAVAIADGRAVRGAS